MGDLICLHNGSLCSTEELADGKHLGPESNFYVDDNFDLIPLHNLHLINSLFYKFYNM